MWTAALQIKSGANWPHSKALPAFAEGYGGQAREILTSGMQASMRK
jgi:hypothetical protein